MNFFEDSKMYFQEKKYINNINYFLTYRFEENYSQRYGFYETNINKKYDNIFPFDQDLDDSEDINEEEIYFIKNINIKENNIVDFNNIDKKTNMPSEKNLEENCINQKINMPSEKNLEENCINQKRKQGRKKKDSLEEGQHNKKTFDNILRRIKISLLNCFRILLNSKIKNVYKFKNLRAKWKLLKINPKYATNSNIEFNKVFIHQSLKEIFSEETTIKNLCNRDHNKILINQLLNEKDEIKRKNFEILFNLTFLDLMKYSIGERADLIQLQGLSLSKKLLNEMSLDEEYSELIFDVLRNIENILENKFPRKRNKTNI